MYKLVVSKRKYGFKVVSGEDKVFKDIVGITVEGERLISFIEALWLCYKGIAEIYLDNGKKLGIEDILALSSDNSLWIKFIVYLDLRLRGKKPSVNVLNDSLCVKSNNVVYEIVVLEETTMFRLSELLARIENLYGKGHEVVLGLVDKHGDVTYYAVIRGGIG